MKFKLILFFLIALIVAIMILNLATIIWRIVGVLALIGLGVIIYWVFILKKNKNL